MLCGMVEFWAYLNHRWPLGAKGNSRDSILLPRDPATHSRVAIQPEDGIVALAECRDSKDTTSHDAPRGRHLEIDL